MEMGAPLGATSPWSLLYGLGGLVFLWSVWRTLEWAWLSPWRLDRALRAQGLRGMVYRFPAGDLKENARLNAESRSKPMPLSHDIVPRVAPLFYNIVKEYGKISITWLGPTPRVIINNPKLVREILSNKFGHFAKRKSNRLLKLLANGLTRHEGDKWATHRKIIGPAFHVEKLKKMLPAFTTCCTELISRWENSIESADGLRELDVWPEFQNLTGDVISRAAFGSSYLEGRSIFQLQSEQAQNVVQAVNTMYIPGQSLLPTKSKRRMEENDRETQELLKEIISKRERAIKNGQANNDDLLGLLMESNIKECEENAKSKMMTMEDIIGECKLFYFAGMETTSVLLTWTMIVLSMHSDWQDRAREEVLHVFKKEKPDFDGLSHLRVVTMILYEVLRLYPPIILLDRRTYKEMELGGVTYPPGVILALPIVFIHHDPDIWGEDANEFNPERFAEGISKASKDSPAFFPFGWGPRICIGQNFALLEAKMGLSMILQHFSFELSPSYTHAPFPVSTLHPEHGAQIKLKKL